MPSTDTWRLLTVVSATFTCGLFRYWPRFNASAICTAAALVVRPATLMLPTSGIRIVPFSSTRVSRVRSGCWNTVTFTASPTPSFSTGCAAFSPVVLQPASTHNSISPNRTDLISPRSGFVSRSPLDVSYVLDARAVAQPAHFGCGKLHALARRQELIDEGRRLLLGERRLLRLKELPFRDAR